jgi:hypothetical protein
VLQQDVSAGICGEIPNVRARLARQRPFFDRGRRQNSGSSSWASASLADPCDGPSLSPVSSLIRRPSKQRALEAVYAAEMLSCVTLVGRARLDGTCRFS